MTLIQDLGLGMANMWLLLSPGCKYILQLALYCIGLSCSCSFPESVWSCNI